MRTTVVKKNENLNFLAMDANVAVSQLIKLTQNLVDYAEQETGALVRNDSIRLAGIQHDKEKMALKYARCSAEFRARIEEFRNVDRTLLDQLESAQNDLSRKTAENNILISQAQRRQAHTSKTQMTLLAAQEYGQKGRTASTTAA